MKIITSLILILAISPVYAKIYKCKDNGKTSYQQTQCTQTGIEFTPGKDISIEQQEAAVEKLTEELEAIAEQKKLQKEEDDKERLISAQEDTAKANKAQAKETALQTEALKNSNKQSVNQPYYTPYRPIIKPHPKQRIAKPLKGIPIAKP